MASKVQKKSSEEAVAEEAYNIEVRVKMAVRSMNSLWVALARDLYYFNVEKLWMHRGCDSFEEWLAGPEIDLKRSAVYDLIKMYNELVVRRGIDEGRIEYLDSSKLQRVLPAIRANRVDVDTALADVEALSFRDIMDRYSAGGSGTVQSSNGSGPDMSTSYDAEREPAMVRCPTCGSRVPSTDITIDHA